MRGYLDWISGPLLRLTGCLGWSTIALPTILHVGRPCHLSCTHWALVGPLSAPRTLGLKQLSSAHTVLSAAPCGPAPTPALRHMSPQYSSYDRIMCRSFPRGGGGPDPV